MKIAVCIKRVPDMDLRFAIGAGGKALDPPGSSTTSRDFDGYAVEVALRLVEQQGPGEVVVISVGPAAVAGNAPEGPRHGRRPRRSSSTPRTCPSTGWPSRGRSRRKLKDGGYDLVLFGRMATDSANQTVGPMTAHLAGLPCVTAVSRLEIAAARGVARARNSRAPARRSSSRCRRCSRSTRAWRARGCPRSRASWPPRRSRWRSSRRSSARCG